MSVKFQSVIFHNKNNIPVQVWTDDGTGEVLRGTLGADAKDTFYMGIENCQSLTISAQEMSAHSKDSTKFALLPGGRLFFETIEASYNIGNIRGKAIALTG